MIKIRKPIWKTRSVGINSNKIISDEVTVEILYKDKSGNRLYPGIYFMSSGKAKLYPIQIVKGNKLHIIPIGDFYVKQI